MFLYEILERLQCGMPLAEFYEAMPEPKYKSAYLLSNGLAAFGFRPKFVEGLLKVRVGNTISTKSELRSTCVYAPQKSFMGGFYTFPKQDVVTEFVAARFTNYRDNEAINSTHITLASREIPVCDILNTNISFMLHALNMNGDPMFFIMRSVDMKKLTFDTPLAVSCVTKGTWDFVPVKGSAPDTAIAPISQRIEQKIAWEHASGLRHLLDIINADIQPKQSRMMTK